MATSDLEGLDPAGAKTPEAFMQLLRQARTASGLSLVEIADRARKRGYELDPVGLARALDQPTLPSWQIVTGLLTACGLAGMQIDRWMRVYHDFATPTQPLPVFSAAAPVASPADEPGDVEPVSVPPLLLTTTEHRSSRVGPKHLAIAGGVVVLLVMAPLLLFFQLNDEQQGIAAAPTSTPPRTVVLAPPPASPTDLPVELSPTPSAAAPTTPAPPRTSGPPPRTTAPPPPPPSPKPPSPTEPSVFSSGTASLTDSQSAELDSGGPDIFRWDDRVLVRTNGARFGRVSGQPGKQTCQGLSESDWIRSVENLQNGQWLCVRTSENRLGRINISVTGNPLKLSYTIWN